MIIKSFIRKLFKVFRKVEKWSEIEEKTIYLEKQEGEVRVIYSIWDYLKFKENTQAFHLSNVIGFDEWVDMEEIRRRIKEIFRMEYKNERSLYPYIKTLEDIGLMEVTNIGGRRKWRKKELFIKIKRRKKDKEKAELKVAKREEK